MWGFILSFCLFSTAAILKIDLAKMPTVTPPNLYLEIKQKQLKKINPLSRLKYDEIHGQWDSCLKDSVKILRNEKEISDVVSSLWLKCFLKSEATFKEQNLDPADFLHKMTTDQKSQYYQKIADKFLLGDKEKSEYFQSLTNKGRNPSSAIGYMPSPTASLLGDLDYQNKIQTELDNKNYLNTVKSIVELLNVYPASTVANIWKDKPLELYYQTGSTSILIEMGEAHYTRIQAWALSLHNKLDYVSALRLAERAIQKSATSPNVAQLYWIAGRSALFTGEYEKALGFFQKLHDVGAGSDEAYEGNFRMALLQFRMGQFATAKNNFIEVILNKRNKYSLNAQYWLYRALQKLNDATATQVRDAIIKDFPFSYYGLRLNAEVHDGKILWPENDLPKKQKNSFIWLAGPSRKKWIRFEKLAQAGLVQEATKEFDEIDMQLNAEQKWLLAQRLSMYQLFLPSIKLANEALDEQPELRKKEFLSFIFPNTYNDLFENEAKKYKVDAALLKSLTRQESAFYPQAISSSNAVGLMQMIPPTAEDVAKALNINPIQIPEDLFLPEISIPMGSYYITDMIKKFSGEVPRALAAYNAGPTRLKQWIKQRKESEFDFKEDLWMDELPWYETSFYVKAILRNIIIYKMIEKGSYAFRPAFWQDFIVTE